MSERDETQAILLQRPANDDHEAWHEYWAALGQRWRWKPEIDAERQKYLTKQLKIKHDSFHGIYTFKNIKLTGADIEWLLELRENGDMPVDLDPRNQSDIGRMDLRGADLRKEDLHASSLDKVSLREAQLQDSNLNFAHLSEALLTRANLQGASLVKTNLAEANLREAQLQGADLRDAKLQGAIFCGAQLQGVNLSDAQLADAHHIGPQLADVQWGDTNLAVVDWSQLTMLGDDYKAQQKLDEDGKEKTKNTRIKEFQEAVRANRQLSIALRNQGLNENASRFAHCAQLMQRKVFWYQRKYGQYLFSLFLDLLSGYGYKPARCFIAYLLVILTFATAYFIIGHKVGPVLSPLGSVVFSMTSFHGRGFFPGVITLDDPLTVVAAFEAFIGLLIEVTFIATLTQRLFGK